MGRDEAFGERKSDADSRRIHLGRGLVFGTTSFPAVETLEDVGKVGLGDARAGVLHAYATRQDILRDAQGHASPCRRVLHAVLEYVAERLDAPGQIALVSGSLLNG